MKNYYFITFLEIKTKIKCFVAAFLTYFYASTASMFWFCKITVTYLSLLFTSVRKLSKFITKCQNKNVDLKTQTRVDVPAIR